MNTRMILFLTLVLMASNAYAQKGAAISVDTAIYREITKSNQLYGDAFVKNNPRQFYDRYALAACIMPAHAETLCGDEAAVTFYRFAYETLGIRNVVLTTHEIFGNGDYVTESGMFELYRSDKTLIDRGKYLVVWKRTPIGWKMFRDAFSPNQ